MSREVRRFRVIWEHRTVCSALKFVWFLTARGIVPEAHIVRERPVNPDLQAFHAWLRQNRGLSETTVRDHDRDVSGLLRDLGNDPERNDATLVRDVRIRCFAKVSKDYARQLVSAIMT